MAKLIEVVTTNIVEVPDTWEIVTDENGEIALKTDSEQYLDFENIVYFADANNAKDDEEIEFKACLDEEDLDMLEEKGLKLMASELELEEIDKEEFEEFYNDDDDFED
jgi:tRNA G46 methylase TrmB